MRPRWSILQPWSTLQPWLGLAARLLLAGVLLYAGLSKLADPGQFVVAVKAYQLLPDWLAHAVAYGLPVFEVAVGLLLVAGLATRLAAAVSAALLVVFLVGVISAAARGLSIDCGCFGGGGAVAAGRTTYLLEIVRDSALLVAAGFLVRWPRSRYAVDDLVRSSVVVTRPDPAARRTKAAREKAAAVLARQRRDARRRVRVVTAGAAAVVVAATGIGMAVQARRAAPVRDVAEVAYAGPVSRATADGIVVGYADAPVTLDIYEDFMCPVCGYFEARSGADILRLTVDHKARLRFHMLNFLDSRSDGTQYSTRAANAAACAADFGLPFVRLHSLLYANQPAENSSGLTDAQLIEYGVRAGAPREAFARCVLGRAHADWPARWNAAAEALPAFQGTPTVRLGGIDLDWSSTRAVVDAVNAAATK